jgi:hypothetical protein
MRQLVCIVVGVALFFTGRLWHVQSRRARAAAGEALARPAVAAEPGAASGRLAGAPPAARLGDVLAFALANMHKKDTSLRTREVMRTIEEPEADRDARHRALNREIDEKSPELTPSKRDVLREVNDSLEHARRRRRAAFMLDALSEDDYIAELKSGVRASFERLKKELTREEFQKLMGRNPESDAFDPTGVYIDPQAPVPMRMTPIERLPTGDSPSDPSQAKQLSP